MSAALRPSLESAACWELFESELVAAVVVVVLLPESSNSFAPATPAMLPKTAAVTSTAAILLTNMELLLGGPSGHGFGINAVYSARLGACLIGDGPPAL